MASSFSVRQHFVEMDLLLSGSEIDTEVKKNKQTKILETTAKPEQKEAKQIGFFFLFS